MSENCSLGKFWNSILNACVPIMDLIDWNRSHPNDICNISSMFGITAAWIFFLRVSDLQYDLISLLTWLFQLVSFFSFIVFFNLQSLKSTALDVGRNVRQEHLNIIADRLFISGEFYGLNKKGLKMQRDFTTNSPPFTFACFSVSTCDDVLLINLMVVWLLIWLWMQI